MRPSPFSSIVKAYGVSVQPWLLTLSSAGVYFLLTYLALHLPLTAGNVTLLYPAAGFALGLALMLGRIAGMGIFLGALVSNIWATGQVYPAFFIALRL